MRREAETYQPANRRRILPLRIIIRLALVYRRFYERNSTTFHFLEFAAIVLGLVFSVIRREILDIVVLVWIGLFAISALLLFIYKRWYEYTGLDELPKSGRTRILLTDSLRFSEIHTLKGERDLDWLVDLCQQETGYTMPDLEKPERRRLYQEWISSGQPVALALRPTDGPFAHEFVGASIAFPLKANAYHRFRTGQISALEISREDIVPSSLRRGRLRGKSYSYVLIDTLVRDSRYRDGYPGLVLRAAIAHIAAFWPGMLGPTLVLVCTPHPVSLIRLLKSLGFTVVGKTRDGQEIFEFRLDDVNRLEIDQADVWRSFDRLIREYVSNWQRLERISQ